LCDPADQWVRPDLLSRDLRIARKHSFFLFSS